MDPQYLTTFPSDLGKKLKLRAGGKTFLEEFGNECAADIWLSLRQAGDETSVCVAPGLAAPEHHSHLGAGMLQSLLHFYSLGLLFSQILKVFIHSFQKGGRSHDL